jgi:hypothetical protein
MEKRTGTILRAIFKSFKFTQHRHILNMAVKHRNRFTISPKYRSKLTTNKIVLEGKVVWLPENDKKALYLDNGKGVGYPLESLLVTYDIPFQLDMFLPYLEKSVNMTLEKEKGKTGKIAITEDISVS